MLLIMTGEALDLQLVHALAHILVHTPAHTLATLWPTHCPWDALLAPVLVRHPGNILGLPQGG